MSDCVLPASKTGRVDALSEMLTGRTEFAFAEARIGFVESGIAETEETAVSCTGLTLGTFCVCAAAIFGLGKTGSGIAGKLAWLVVPPVGANVLNGINVAALASPLAALPLAPSVTITRFTAMGGGKYPVGEKFVPDPKIGTGLAVVVGAMKFAAAAPLCEIVGPLPGDFFAGEFFAVEIAGFVLVGSAALGALFAVVASAVASWAAASVPCAAASVAANPPAPRGLNPATGPAAGKAETFSELSAKIGFMAIASASYRTLSSHPCTPVAKRVFLKESGVATRKTLWI